MNRILMYGPTLDGRGGVASVEAIMATLPAGGIAFRHRRTHGGSHALTMLFFVWAWISAAFTVPFHAAVHVHLSPRGSAWRKWLICFWPALYRKPYIIHAHGAEFDSYYNGLPAPARRILSRWMRDAAAVIALSEQWKAFYTSKVGVREECVHVIHNPARLPVDAASSQAASAKAICFLGRIGERKGVFDLIRAYGRLPEAVRSEAPLHIAGDGDAQRLLDLLDELGLRPWVTIHGWLEHAQAVGLLERCGIFALPSHHEGLPMAMLEAMARGLAPLVSEAGGMKEIVRHRSNGWLVEAGSVASIQEGLQALLADDELRKRIGSQAFADSRQYGEAAFADKLFRLYRDVLPA